MEVIALDFMSIKANRRGGYKHISGSANTDLCVGAHPGPNGGHGGTHPVRKMTIVLPGADLHHFGWGPALHCELIHRHSRNQRVRPPYRSAVFTVVERRGGKTEQNHRGGQASGNIQCARGPVDRVARVDPGHNTGGDKQAHASVKSR